MHTCTHETKPKHEVRYEAPHTILRFMITARTARIRASQMPNQLTLTWIGRYQLSESLKRFMRFSLFSAAQSWAQQANSAP